MRDSDIITNLCIILGCESHELVDRVEALQRSKCYSVGSHRFSNKADAVICALSKGYIVPQHCMTLDEQYEFFLQSGVIRNG